MIGFNWLFGGRATTDDTEELIHLENLNQNTIRTATQTLGKINRLAIEKEAMHDRDVRLLRLVGENRNLRLKVHELEGQSRQSAPGRLDSEGMEKLLRDSLFKEMAAFRAGQLTDPNFHQRCQETSLNTDVAFRELVDRTLARRLDASKTRAQPPQDGPGLEPLRFTEGLPEKASVRQIRRIRKENTELRARLEQLESQAPPALRRASGDDLMRVVKIEGLVRESIVREMTARHVGQQADSGFVKSCQEMEEDMAHNPGFAQEVAHAVASRLGSVGMASRRNAMRP